MVRKPWNFVACMQQLVEINSSPSLLLRYKKHNLTDAPMKYSPELAKSAKAWANELLNACGVVGIEHEDYNPFGENCK
jgi:hypothetical protein